MTVEELKLVLKDAEDTDIVFVAINNNGGELNHIQFIHPTEYSTMPKSISLEYNGELDATIEQIKLEMN